MLKILKKARALVARRGRWAQEYYATRDGVPIDEWTVKPAGTCFCVMGAVRNATTNGGRDLTGTHHMDARVVSEQLGETLGAMGLGRNIPSYNDRPSTTQGDVVALFDLTIERLEAIQ